jgi:hypothetical protein
MFVLIAKSPGDDLIAPSQWPVAVSADVVSLQAQRDDLTKQAKAAQDAAPWWMRAGIADRYEIEEVPAVP